MLLPMLLRGLLDGVNNGGQTTLRELANITEGVEGEDIASKSPQSVPGVKIGFFLHTPFPSSEIYRCADRLLFPALKITIPCT
jgi:trehalose 6-phosphate synthase